MGKPKNREGTKRPIHNKRSKTGRKREARLKVYDADFSFSASVEAGDSDI
jgi:hypothetical protein